jgi:hypothetical protein
VYTHSQTHVPVAVAARRFVCTPYLDFTYLAYP